MVDSQTIVISLEEGARLNRELDFSISSLHDCAVQGGQRNAPIKLPQIKCPCDIDILQ